MLTKKQITGIKFGVRDDAAGFPLVFQALGDSGRFNIFRLLMNRHDICVTDVANVFSITVSAASQQFRVLERLGLVVKMRIGQTVCYELNHKKAIVKQLINLIKESNK